MGNKTIIIIGISTGEPKTLKAFFRDMPRLDAPVIIVQHMSKFINEPFARNVNDLTEMNVVVPSNGDRLVNGTIYVAPSEVHMSLMNNQRVKLHGGPKVCFVKPSIDVTMKSVLKKPNQKIIGIVMTGMGNDGAAGLSHIKSIGGVTVDQDKQSSIIYGMPKAAVETGNVDHVMTPEQIKERLIAKVGVIKDK